MCRLNLFVIFSILRFIPLLHSAKILCIFDLPFLSHQIVFRSLTHELATRGHEMTIFTTHPEFSNSDSPKNYKEIDIQNVTCNITEYLEKNKERSKTVFSDLVTLLNDLDECNSIQQRYVKDVLRNYNKDYFDLVIMESASGRRYLIMSYIMFKVPIIKISSIGRYINDFQDMGAATHPILYPNMNQHKLYNLTPWEKIYVFFEYLVEQWIIIPELDKIQHRVARKDFGKDIPSLQELANSIDLLFLNTHEIWETNVPVPPNVIHIWGIHLNTTKNNLPADLEPLLESSRNGVILMSFGSVINTSDLPNNTRQDIMRALARMPYDIFLKWENDDLPEHPKNVHIRKWWPQADLLKHPKIKVFISHGGLTSINEAIIGGVPIVNIPVFGDQFYNAEKCVHHKVGLKLDLESITEDKFFKTIKSVAEDDSYRRNMIKLRSVMLDQPQSALERAVWWTEYVLRHGGAKHLRSPAANVTWGQYYEIELVATVLCGIVTICILISFVLYNCYKWLRVRRFCCEKTCAVTNGDTNIKVKSN